MLEKLQNKETVEKTATLNTLMDYINNNLNCDTDCQREKEIESLRKKWQDSKNLLKTLPDTVNKNEKNYYVEKKGLEYYQNNILRIRYEDYINKWRDKQLEELEQSEKIMNIMLQNLISQSNSKSKLNQLYDELLSKNKQLKLEIDEFYKKTFTNGRRAWYQSKDNENTVFWRFYLKIFYFAVLVAYLIFGGFVKNSEYKQWKTWLFLIFYIIFPFILHHIITILINIYEERTNSAPG